MYMNIFLEMVTFVCIFFSGDPVCDSPFVDNPVDLSHKPRSPPHTGRFIMYTVLAVVALVVISVTIFLGLQYFTLGRCAIRSSTSNLLVDGNGVVKYSSLTDKDNEGLMSEDETPRANSKKSYITYDSD